MRLGTHRWAFSSLLMYGGVVGCAILVAALGSIGLQTNGLQPIPQAATVDRSASLGPSQTATATTAVPAPPTAQAQSAPAVTTSPATTTTTMPVPTGAPTDGSSANQAPITSQGGSEPIQPQTVSPNGSVVEVTPGSDSKSPSHSIDSSSSRDSTSTTTAKSGS